MTKLRQIVTRKTKTKTKQDRELNITVTLLPLPGKYILALTVHTKEGGKAGAMEEDGEQAEEDTNETMTRGTRMDMKVEMKPRQS